jgi:hypothetical protein
MWLDRNGSLWHTFNVFSTTPKVGHPITLARGSSPVSIDAKIMMHEALCLIHSSLTINKGKNLPMPTSLSGTFGYSGKPLAQKLGLVPGQRAFFANAPVDLTQWLAPTVDEVELLPRISSAMNIALLFVTETKALEKMLPRVTAKMAPKGMIWIAWPKKSSKVATDITEDVVRTVILPTGWVDVKVCAISEVWSGLKFLRRAAAT